MPAICVLRDGMNMEAVICNPQDLWTPLWVTQVGSAFPENVTGVGRAVKWTKQNSV